MDRENAHITDLLVDLVDRAVPDEEPFPALRRNMLDSAGRVSSEPCRVNGLIVYVSRENLHRGRNIELPHVFGQENGDGVCLFPAGAARHPDPHP